MARSSRLARRTRVITRTVVARAAPVARRVGGAALAAARDEKHTLVALGTAAAVGYMRREQMLANLPAFDALGVEGTYALAAFMGARFMRSRTLSHVATGLGCIAINRLAAGDD